MHPSIADRVIEMIQGAVQELVSHNAADLATDVGPAIDREAYDDIQRHLTRLISEAKPLLVLVKYEQTASNSVANTMEGDVLNLIAPQAYEVKSIADVKVENFGSVQQVVR